MSWMHWSCLEQSLQKTSNWRLVTNFAKHVDQEISGREHTCYKNILHL